MGELNNTVIAGVLIFVIGQLVSRFMLDPLHERRKLRGEIAHALHYYANVYVAEGFHTREFGQEAVHRYRDLAGQVWQRACAIPAPVHWLLSSVRMLPNWPAIEEAASGLTGLSNSVIGDRHDDRDGYRRAIRKALRLRQ